MTPEQRLACQTLIIDEMASHQQDAPTMLIDALLADQGFAFLEAVLKRRANQASQAAQMTLQLYRGLAAHVPPVLAAPEREEVA
jgi:hypothetical protein